MAFDAMRENTVLLVGKFFIRKVDTGFIDIGKGDCAFIAFIKFIGDPGGGNSSILGYVFG